MERSGFRISAWLFCLPLLFLSVSSALNADMPGPEICNNAIDDDGDGLTDLNDPDCTCPELKPVSLIPNPSFEDRTCCPQDRSQLFCAQTWIQASEATTDYLHTCGWMGWPNLPPPLPIPDGNAFIGFRNGRFRGEQGNSEPNWKEYTGACLTRPLRANTNYRFEFNIGFTFPVNSPPTEVVIFGSTDCKNLPFGVGNPGYGCPTNGPGWVELGSVRVFGSREWITTGISIKPKEDIYAIAFGPNCIRESATTDLYYFLDNLILDEQRAFDFQITGINHPCSQQFTLSVPNADTLSYQWYKDGIALPGETASTLMVKTGEGRYQVLLTGPSGACKVTRLYNYFIPRFRTDLKEYICEGETYTLNKNTFQQSGVYQSMFKSVDNCDSLVQVDLEVLGLQGDTVEARIFEGEKYELGPRRLAQRGIHSVSLVSSKGCDSLVYVDLDFYRVFRPSAFSPDNDGINDTFTLFGGNDLIRISNLEVFNRWGALVFSQKEIAPNDTSAGWNGEINSRPAPEGVYVYLARVRMDDGKDHLLSGSVLLMR